MKGKAKVLNQGNPRSTAPTEPQMPIQPTSDGQFESTILHSEPFHAWFANGESIEKHEYLAPTEVSFKLGDRLVRTKNSEAWYLNAADRQENRPIGKLIIFTSDEDTHHLFVTISPICAPIIIPQIVDEMAHITEQLQLFGRLCLHVTTPIEDEYCERDL